MGNQGYSNDGTRRCAEMIWAGEIGNVTEVHAWTNRPVWPQGLHGVARRKRRCPRRSIGKRGSASQSMRPYSPAYAAVQLARLLRFRLRRAGRYGMPHPGRPNMALMLGSPTSVECIKQEGKSSFMFPKKSVIRFDFPARGSMPAVKVFWYDGCMDAPFRPEGIAKNEILGDLPRRRPAAGQQRAVRSTLRNLLPALQLGSPTGRRIGSAESKPKAPAEVQERPAHIDTAGCQRQARCQCESLVSRGSNGSLFVGDKGYITTGTYGENTRLLPVEKMARLQVSRRSCSPARPVTITIGFALRRAAIRPAPTSASLRRLPNGCCWACWRCDSKASSNGTARKCAITNNPEANRLIKPTFRKGWQFS